MVSERDDPPFKRGDVVISNLNHLTVKVGDKVRVLECGASNDCESGWLITATSTTKGPITSRSPIAMQGIDSGWFEKVKRHANR